ncbi:MAG: metal-dependent hydrolase [Planctomycetes bacterium]|nr:metal-dependent hydrolase [Planctomycetota bacterium]
MDTPTQVVLGAAVGQALFGHRLGRRAAVWGAVGGLIPDLDMIAAAATGAWGEFVLHRGPTHSLFFGPVLGPLLGWMAWRIGARRRASGAPTGPASRRRDPALRATWIGLFTAALFTHPLLDALTTYGTQLLWPLSSHRFAIDAIAIIDPIYTVALLTGVVLAWRIRGGHGRAVAAAALGITTAYLGFCWALNAAAEAAASRQLAARGVAAAHVKCYPTLLQPFHRRAVARAGDTIHVGTYTFLNPGPIRWQSFSPSRDPLVEEVLATRLGRIFRWFAMEQLAAAVIERPDGYTVEIDDLRYGIPGAPAAHGLWGIRATFDRARRPRGEVERFRRPLPAPPGAVLRQFWLELLGTPAEGAPAARLSPGPIASVRLAPCGFLPPMGNIRCWKPAPPAMLRSQVAGPEARSTAGVE